MWIGQFNALLAVAAVVLAGIAYLAGKPEIFMGGAAALVVLRLGVGVLNLLSKVFRGKPLIYTVRIDAARDGSSRAS
ncbi:hypothetical protein [Magnetospirillum aberrantis]|uniref:Uncharacterized protein n=1 Tax=Magnetospirillum aberrantis SpK TaxID=908842 RepID=A0A7C9QU14_9PROT|nr:hypothetical protein [Magnetospirillum aberrantis]NFV80079.1 hypothetical protein [Magnetospirillum aberrantis SpK]